MKAARARTESMAQRLAKKPIAEGFELWDKGFTLGAMRLFIFKAESAPPFQLGPCLDAVANLLLSMGELEDAAENFRYAEEKYDLIQQPLLAKVMAIHGTLCMAGVPAALQQVNSLIAESDPAHKAHEATDPKVKVALARAYFLRAELATKLEEGADLAVALADIEYVTRFGWDRQHTAFNLMGSIKMALGDVEGATLALQQAIHASSKYLAPHLQMADIAKSTGNAAALGHIESAILVHPRSSLMRDKAFMLSEQGSDAAAIEFLDQMIAHPDVEESEGGLSCEASSVATLQKAKAAIFADAGKMTEALGAAEAALVAVPGDEEAEHIIADIKAAC